MAKTTKKQTARIARRRRVRGTVSGTAARPRLTVFRSLTHISAQIIDDASGKTLATANDAKIAKGTKTEKAAEVGKALADAAKKAKVTTVVFDRNGCKYHGRIKALADAARDGGLQF